MPILDWINKKETLKIADKTPYRVLVENKELSYGDQSLGNMIIKGDNLEALKALLPYYKGQVKCIYIDPPYNTGNAFEHYDDNLEHSTWLSLMYPRLELLRELLLEDGLIFISIDNKEHSYMKNICDEIFGRNNFRSNIIWKKVSSAKSQSLFVGNVVEYILVYSKTNLFKFYPIYLEGKNDDKNYPYIEKETGRRYGSFDFTQKGQGEARYFWNELLEPPKNKHWIWTQEKIDEGIKNNIIFRTKNGIPRLKRYYDNKKGNYISDLWDDSDVSSIQANSKEAMDFFGQKPEGLVKRILSIASKENDLILDSFLGSGTTCAVAQKMNRRYIGIEMGEHAITHCVPRLKKVIDGIDDGGISKNVNWKGGGGYTFYDLGNSIFDTEGNINSNIKFKDLAFHVWFSETKTPLKNYKHSPLIGICKDTAYYLLYNGILGDKSISGGNVLTSKLLAKLPKYNGKKIIYGEVCRLSTEKLLKENIIFKQTPYEIKAR